GDEHGVLVVDVDVRGLRSAPVGLTTLGDRVDAAFEDAGDDARPVDGVHVGVQAQSPGPGGLQGYVGSVDVHLRGDAAHVQAGAAERPCLDDRDRPVLQLRAGDRVA